MSSSDRPDQEDIGSAGAGKDNRTMSSNEYENKRSDEVLSSEMKESSGAEGIPQSEAREDVTFHQDTTEERDEATTNDSTQTKNALHAPTNVAGAVHRKPKKPQDSQQQPQQPLQSQQPPNNGRFYGGGMQHPQAGAHFGAGMPRGPYHHGGPYPYAAGSSGPPFPPPHGYHHSHAHQMPPMPPHFNGGAGGPYAAMNARGSGNSGGAGGNGGPYSHYGNHPYGAASNLPPAAAYSSHGMPPSYPNNSSSNMSDSASIGSKGSKSSKKRTIDGVHESSSSMGPASSSAYAFRRSDSNTSTTSTVTAGNNTSIETYATEDTGNNNSSNNKGDSSNRNSDMLVSSANFDDYDHYNEARPMRTRYHRRDCSADGSTTSSLSAGFSLASYEGRRDPTENPICKSSPKRMKGGDGEPLSVDTHMRPPSAASHEADQSTRFEQLSIGVKEEPETTKSDSSNESGNQKLFLSLSTSPINADVDATPISKNTAKPSEGATNKGKATGIFKEKGAAAASLNLEVSTSASSGSSPPPPPPPQSDHGDLGDVDMMGDDHSTLNRHLRGQTFTPVNHLSSNATDQASSHADGQFSIAPQLSWNSITGDTPSLGDLAEWEEESKSKHSTAADQKIKPSSTVDSHDSRGMSISPHHFHLWKEDHELVDQAIGGATTPLPAFFESGREGNDRSENQMTNYDPRAKKHSSDEARPTFVTSSNRHHGHGNHSARPMPHHWNKHDHHMNHSMPPTPPMYASGTDYRDDTYPMVRSPYGGDRRDQIDGAGAFPFFPHPGTGMHNNERVRNLRGRMPPGHFPPMLHIPPPMSGQLPMTSPMAMPNKAGLWSPHGGLPPLNSPHHLTSPMNSMHGQTKRKCVPLKPPIPSKFQGDPEKVKNIPVPEFTSLVNFPSHMSQKQAVNLPEGMRCCVMCGNACPSSNGGKNKNKKKAGEGGLAQRSNNSQDMIGDKSSGYAQIPTQNKGLCTLCDVNVWVVVANGLEIKWCKGCKNFRPWAAFGDKGLATKCLRCRERQREKYALQKEEKEKARNAAAIKNKS